MNILVVDDEIQLADAITEILKREKYNVSAVYNGEDALDYATNVEFDLIVLDVMLPKIDGLEVLKKLRERGKKVPVLLLTAKSDVNDKIKGLDYGADDYLTKPFDARELVARIKALARRKGEYIADVYKRNDLILDKNNYKLSYKNQSIVLGAKEFEIMEMLLGNLGKIIPKERFIEKIWGLESDAEYNAIEVYVSFLRKKLITIGANAQIKSIRSVGYKIEFEDKVGD